MSKPYGFLKQEHPVYKRLKKAWKRDERRYRGADGVLNELTRFDWEKTSKHYAQRQAKATYINFGALKASALSGHLMANAPRPGAGLSFGTLGEVRPKEERRTAPSRAELVYFNVDGVGNSGSQWDPWWMAVHRWAMVTGHRWVMATTPSEAPLNRLREQQGLHPYLVHLSPLRVINWHSDERGLAWAVVTVPRRKVELRDGKLVGNDGALGYLLLVRKGETLFGPDFAGGGWWEFDADTEPTGSKGTWERTKGEIPLWPHFAERDEGTTEEPALSRPQLTELMQIAVSLMDLSSAADFDAIDAAASIQWLLGVDVPSHEAAMDVIEQGGRWVPLQAPVDGEGRVDVKDGSMGAVTSEVFQRRIEALLEMAHQHFATAASTPDASGKSKQMGFLESIGPQLSRYAYELEASQNIAIHFLELLFGGDGPKSTVLPGGEVQWQRQWDLAPLGTDVEDILRLQETAGVRSPTLTAEVLAMAVEAKGLIVDLKLLARIRAELLVAAHDAATAARQADAESAEVRDLRRSGRRAGVTDVEGADDE